MIIFDAIKRTTASAKELIWLSVVNRENNSPPLGLRVFLKACLPGYRERRDLVATCDHSDIRGLGTAWLVFFAELPRSKIGSSANALFT
jgi:hypothetical protein